MIPHNTAHPKKGNITAYPKKGNILLRLSRDEVARIDRLRSNSGIFRSRTHLIRSLLVEGIHGLSERIGEPSLHS
jgi:hypothetical protein